MSAFRGPALVLLPAALVGLFLLDGQDRDAVTDMAFEPPIGVPAYASDEALGSTWYCAAGTANDDGFADHEVLLVNPTDSSVSGRLTIYPAALSDGVPLPFEAQIQDLQLRAGDRDEIRLGDVVDAPYAAALLEFDGPGVVVDHRVTGATGADTAACASAPSPTWYFAAGDTSADAREILVLFNPFPEAAVVDIDFATDDGGRRPQAYQGIVVPGGTIAPVDITDVVTRFHTVSASVETRVGSGRLVVDRLQIYDGTAGRSGLSVAAGSPQRALEWIFPVGPPTAESGDGYVIYNPGEVGDPPAAVELDLRLDDTGQVIEPYELTISPGQRWVVLVNASPEHPRPPSQVIDTQSRLPDRLDHWVFVRSFNEVPIVVERVSLAPTGAAAAGLSITPGSPAVSVNHIVGYISTSPPATARLAVVNPSPSAISRVSISALVDGQTVPIPELQEIEIAPTRRVWFDLDEFFEAADFSLVVTASEPVAVERSLSVPGQLGLTASMSVLDGGSLSEPDSFGLLE